MRHRSPAIADWIASIAVGCVDAQRALDRFRRRPAAGPAGGNDGFSETSPETPEVLDDPCYRFRSHEIDVRLLLTQRWSAKTAAGIELSGDPLHAFLYHRMATERTEVHRLAITVEAAPLPPYRDATTQESEHAQ